MRFAETNTRRGKGTRACSLLMAVLIMCSMLFVGQVGTIEADADTVSFTIDVNNVIYNSGTWASANAQTWVTYWSNGNQSAKYLKYATPNGDGTYTFTFPDSIDADNVEFIVLRFDPSQTTYSTGTTHYIGSWIASETYLWDRTGTISGSDRTETLKLYTDKDSNGFRTTSWARTVSAETTIQVDLSDPGWWGDAFCLTYIKWTDNNGVEHNDQIGLGESTTDIDADGVADGVASDNLYEYTFTEDFDGSIEFIRRNPNNTETYNTVSTSIPTDGNSRVKIKAATGSSTPTCTWSAAGSISFTNDLGTTLTADVGYETDTTFKNSDGTTYTLQPVRATFYDYFTDNEINTKTWRNNQTYSASRHYSSRQPFSLFNNYISSIVDNSAGWEYPLYFGDFYTEANQTLAGVWSINDNDRIYKNNTTYSNYSYQVNNSTSLLLSGEGYKTPAITLKDGTVDYYGTKRVVTGLVNETLVNGNMTMGTGSVESPYFSDTTVADGYANKITTQFPFRVTTETATGTDGKTEVSYNKYQFQSSLSTGSAYNNNPCDNIYFTNFTNEGTSYEYDGFSNLVIDYSYGSAKAVKDAKSTYGGKTDGYGFFPFDNGDKATDFGFGMKLEIDFTLGNYGCIAGTNTPVKFEFTGDDDLWVFVDGVLVLDMGGDHAKASGEIDFNKLESTVNTSSKSDVGAATNQGTDEYVLANADNWFGNATTYTNNGTEQTRNGAFPTLFGDGASTFDNNDSTTVHTLTVFYMERGMVESNLDMSFTFSPVTDRLTVDKTVEADGVNDGVAETVDSDMAATEFDFQIKESIVTIDSNGNVTGKETDVDTDTIDSYKYTDQNGAEGSPENASIKLKDGEKVDFDDQFTNEDGRVSLISIEETSKSPYSFSTSNVVRDKTDITADANGRIMTMDGQTGTYTGQFTFGTRSSSINASTYIDASYTNTLELGEVTITKEAKEADGSAITDTSYRFKVGVQLPGQSGVQYYNLKYTMGTTEYTATDGVLTLKNGQTATISGIPVNSKVYIEETGLSDSDYSTSINGGTVSGRSTTVDVNTANATTNVKYTNTKIAQSVSLSLTATKQIEETSGTKRDPSGDEVFSFTLQECDKDGNVISNGEKQTKSNSGKTVTFDAIEYKNASTYYYKITETSTSDENFTTDSTVYYVKVVVTLSKSQYSATPYYYQTTISGDGSTDNIIKFVNTEKEKSGSVTVKKVKSDGTTPINGAEITLVAAENVDGKWVPETGAESKILTIGSDGQVDGQVKFTDVSAGDYVVYESKAPEGYELNGEYHYVEVKAGQENTVLVDSPIVDQTSTDLPETGGIGVVIFVVVGVVLIVAAILLLKPKKEKTTSAEKSE